MSDTVNKYKRYSVLFCSLLSFVAFSPAWANAFADYSASVQRFSQLQAQAAASHAVPTLSDPEAAKVLATLSNHRRFLDAQSFTDRDIQNLMGTCESANQVVQSYTLFDLGSSLNKTIKDPAEAARITAAVALRNIIKYQDEATPLFAFEMICLAKEIPLLERFAAKLAPTEFTAERRAGLTQARNGMFSVFFSMAQIPIDAAISLSNRRELITAMAEVAPSFARILDPATRRQAHDHLAAQVARVPMQFAEQYRQLIDALNVKDCEGLCRL